MRCGRAAEAAWSRVTKGEDSRTSNHCRLIFGDDEGPLVTDLVEIGSADASGVNVVVRWGCLAVQKDVHDPHRVRSTLEHAPAPSWGLKECAVLQYLDGQ
jgi:hypothetical protein